MSPLEKVAPKTGLTQHQFVGRETIKILYTGNMLPLKKLHGDSSVGV
jgi:hypothetical protein